MARQTRPSRDDLFLGAAWAAWLRLGEQNQPIKVHSPSSVSDARMFVPLLPQIAPGLLQCPDYLHNKAPDWRGNKRCRYNLSRSLSMRGCRPWT